VSRSCIHAAWWSQAAVPDHAPAVLAPVPVPAGNMTHLSKQDAKRKTAGSGGVRYRDARSDCQPFYGMRLLGRPGAEARPAGRRPPSPRQLSIRLSPWQRRCGLAKVPVVLRRSSGPNRPKGEQWRASFPGDRP